MAITDKVQTNSIKSAKDADIFKPRQKIPFLPIIGVCVTAIVAIGVVIGLMWQSNAFIALNQDVRSDASSAPEASAVVQNGQLSNKDRRFGVGGDCQIAKDMNVSWMFNWGSAWTGLINEEEIKCAENSDGQLSTILTVGHANAWDHTNGIIDSSDDSRYQDLVVNAENTLTGVEKTDYIALKNLINLHPSVYNSVKILASFLQVPQLAARYPNAYWQIGNEPDWSPYFSPKDYAEYYNAFHKQIKRYDPSAKVGMGGLAFPQYNDPQKMITGYIDWTLWSNITSQFGGTGAVTAVSISPQPTSASLERFITRGGEIYQLNPTNEQWQKITSNFSSVGSGKITSYYSRYDANQKREFLTRGGKVWFRSNNASWSEINHQIFQNSGVALSFSETKNINNVRVQYVVTRNNLTTDSRAGIKLFYRNCSSSACEAWGNLTDSFSLVGKGNLSSFNQYLHTGDREQFVIRGGKVWYRTGQEFFFKNELVQDPYIVSLKNANPSKAALYENGAWFLLFLKQYRDKYGVNNPPMDFLNFHPYAWTPYNTGNGAGYTDSTIGQAVEDSKQSIQHIYTLSKDQVTGLANTPLIITEFSHAGKEKCTSVDNCESQTELVRTYINQLVTWMKSNVMVHRWLWFYAGPPDSVALSGLTNIETLGTHLMYSKSNGQLNTTAEAYVTAMNAASGKDQISPQITAIQNTSFGSGNPPLRQLAITISEAQPSAGYEYAYCLGKVSGGCDLKLWASRLTRATTMSIYPPASVSGYSGTVYVTVKVTDSFGNSSQTVSGPIMSMSL